MKDYGKIPSSLWSDPLFLGMSDDPRMLLLYLMTCTHSTIAGVFRLPEGYASEDLNWPIARVSKGFAELLRNGFVKRCETTKWTWVTRHFQTNTLDNPNQVKSAAKCAQLIPDQCTWKQAFMRDCSQLLGLAVIDQPEPLPNGSGTLSESGTVSGTGTGDRPSVSSPAVAADLEPSGPLPCPHGAIRTLYADLLPGLPQIRKWDADRERALRQRWVSTAAEKGWSTVDEGLDWFRRFFLAVSENDWAMGRSGRGKGHENWECDIDYLLTPKGFRRIIESAGRSKEPA